MAEALGIRRGTRAPLIQRTLLADGVAAAYMRDVVHPDVALPPPDELRAQLEAGRMVLDVLMDHGVPIAFARTQVRPRLIEPASRLGEAMGTPRLAAALELVELLHLADGKPVHFSTEVFAPGSIDLHVIRGLKLDDEPAGDGS